MGKDGGLTPGISDDRGVGLGHGRPDEGQPKISGTSTIGPKGEIQGPTRSKVDWEVNRCCQ